MLRCLELGLSVTDLDNLTIGFVTDMLTEKINDDVEYDVLASQDDFNNF